MAGVISSLSSFQCLSSVFMRCFCIYPVNRHAFLHSAFFITSFIFSYQNLLLSHICISAFVFSSPSFLVSFHNSNMDETKVSMTWWDITESFIFFRNKMISNNCTAESKLSRRVNIYKSKTD